MAYDALVNTIRLQICSGKYWDKFTSGMWEKNHHIGLGIY
jgi:hypothetical protein